MVKSLVAIFYSIVLNSAVATQSAQVAEASDFADRKTWNASLEREKEDFQKFATGEYRTCAVFYVSSKRSLHFFCHEELKKIVIEPKGKDELFLFRSGSEYRVLYSVSDPVSIDRNRNLRKFAATIGNCKRKGCDWETAEDVTFEDMTNFLNSSRLTLQSHHRPAFPMLGNPWPDLHLGFLGSKRLLFIDQKDQLPGPNWDRDDSIFSVYLEY